LIVSIGTLTTTILELFASDLATYGLSRFAFGLTRVCLTVANGMICDLVKDEKERSAAIGKNFSGMGVGFLVGSAAGGVVATLDSSYRLASTINFAMALVSLTWVIMFLKETKQDVNKETDKKKDSSSSTNGKKNGGSKVEDDSINSASNKMGLLDALKSIMGEPELRTLFLFHACVLVCNISPQHAYAEYIRVDLDLSTSLRGLFLVSIGIATVFAQMTFPLAIAKLGTPLYVRLALIGCAITSFLAPLGGMALFSVATLVGTFCSVVTSVSLSTLSKSSPSHLSGTVNGLHESLTNLALVIGGLYVPFTTAFHKFAPFWLSSVAILVTLALVRPSLLLSNSQKQKKE
jgi:predicted MFS family arabinose efflux permease